MNTPFGRINRFPIFFVLGAIVVIVVGLIIPGHAGDDVEAIAWAIVAVAIIIRFGFRTTPRGYRGEGPRP
jgi:hypothetical protein